MNELLLDDRVIERDELLLHLGTLTGAVVTGVKLNPASLNLTIAFRSGSVLELIPDPGMDDIAWMMSLPGRRTLSADATGHWRLENNEDRGKSPGDPNQNT